MAIKAILFDKDGTLIDFDATWGPAAYEVMRTLAGGDRAKLARLVGVSEYVEETRSFRPSSPLVGGSSAEYGPLWAWALGREPNGALYREMDDLFREWGLRTLSPIGNPAAILSNLAGFGLTLGIATNDAEASARAQIEAMGLSGLVTFVAGYDSGFGSKPDPGMVTAFAEHHGLAAHEVALVGDSLHDLLAARAAGAAAIAVLTGPLKQASAVALGPHADHMLGSIADLPAFFRPLQAGAPSGAISSGVQGPS
jgi:phosphoglycolate phosphatase